MAINASKYELPRGDIERELKGHTNVSTQTLKQADYLMLPFVFPESYPPELLKVNFEYYEARNSHGSSLSLAPHCVAAAMADMPEKAYEYYVRAGSTDLRSRWHSDDGGLHAAACGALPLALWLAFAGMRRAGNDLAFRPALPKQWRSLRFKLWRNGAMQEFFFENK